MLALATTAAPIRKRRRQIDDAAFIAALDLHNFRTAPTIARHMLESGTPATLPVIARRMAEYVEVGGVEADGKSWRIAANHTPPSPTTPIANDNMPTIAIPATAAAPTLHHGCGLDMMRSLPDRSIDLVLCDLPYGSTGLAIDPKIDVTAWMDEMRRIVTDRGAIVAFSAQPFTTDLMNAGRDIFKQEIIWEKVQPTGFQQSAARHLKAHENILVFSKGTVIAKRSKRQMVYNPQGAVVVRKKTRENERTCGYLKNQHTTVNKIGDFYEGLTNCPRSVLYGPKDRDAHTYHSFAKPIWLLEYLIRTYTNDTGLVLDPTMGSGSTGLACIATGRKFLGAENGIDRKGRCIFTMAKDRIAGHDMANDNANPSKPRRRPPVVRPARPRPPSPQPDDTPPPMIIPAY